jgi:hypothetical protein
MRRIGNPNSILVSPTQHKGIHSSGSVKGILEACRPVAPKYSDASAGERKLTRQLDEVTRDWPVLDECVHEHANGLLVLRIEVQLVRLCHNDKGRAQEGIRRDDLVTIYVFGKEDPEK